MASLRERIFTVAEMRDQVNVGRGYANYALNRNKQEHFERYELLALALEQALAEIDRLQSLVPKE